MLIMDFFRTLAILFCLLPFSLFSEEVSGRVVRVADGDTITVLAAPEGRVPSRAARQRHDGVLVGGIKREDPAPAVSHKIRLHGIDAPESGQAFGNAAKSHLSSLVAGRNVRVKWKSRDKYGRILGVVYLDGKDINLEMLKAGFAWHYKRFDSTPAYAQAESAARTAKKGLWADKNPIQPELFRHPDRSVSSANVGVASSANVKVPDGYFSSNRVEYRAGGKMPVGSRVPAPVCDQWPDTGYWLSVNSNKRHNRGCENYRKTRGYPCRKNEGTPCGKCGG